MFYNKIRIKIDNKSINKINFANLKSEKSPTSRIELELFKK